MSRYRQETNGDTRVDLDPGFIGVNSKVEPSLLRTGHAFYDVNQQLAGPGVVSQAINCRFQAGSVETRPGSVRPSCFNPTGIGTILGSGIFSDPNGRQWLLLATASGVYKLADGSTPTRIIGLPSAVTLTAPVDLVQAFNEVILFRGSGAEAEDAAAPLVWDGDIGTDFAEITATSDGSFTEAIPNAGTAEVFSGRLYAASTRDQVAVSDLLEYTRWDPLLSAFRLNSGEDDKIVALHPYRRNNLLVFKDQSVYVLANTYGALSDIRAELVNGDLGCAAQRSVATVGSDVFFLAHDGVYRLGEIVENSMATQEVPVSDAIEPIIERINPAAIHKAVAVVHDNYYRLAVALDDSAVNNAVLIFDTTTGQWQGYDEYPVNIDRFHRLDWHDKRHAIGIDYANGTVTVLDTGGPEDITPTGATAITTQLTTRGYVLGDSGIKRFRTVTMALETHNPTIKVEALMEGQNEVEVLAENVTRNRLKYSTHAKADYDPTNTNDDHAAAKREDYSVDLAVGAPLLSATGFNPHISQSWFAGYTVRLSGRWVAFRVTNTTGTMTLKTVQADAVRIPQTMRKSM